MKTCICILSVFFVVTLLACTERNPVLVEPESQSCFSVAKAANPAAAFEGTFTVRTQPTHNDLPNGGCNNADFRSVALRGSGHSTLMDVTHARFFHCEETAANTDDPSEYNVVNGWLELTDDAGNRIVASYQGEHVVAARDTLRGTFILTEGGGDFAGVQGNGCFRAISTGNFGEYALELRGEM